jgi:hypothetical protein
LIGAAVIAVAAAATGASHRAHADGERSRDLVETAAAQFTHLAINDAWMQMKLGNAVPLDALRQSVALRYLATHEDGDAVILTFAGHRNTCVDLISRPLANTVETRHC